MFRLEEQLWWYRILHETVLKAIQQQFGERRDIRIFDAGCGTGGLLHYLKRQGYTNLRGVDGSADAVAFCKERDLAVDLVNLTAFDQYQRAETTGYFDVVVCDDVFCYFNDNQLATLLGELALRLQPNGILITNNNAFGVFKGTHDIAVGSTRRFVRADFDRFLPQSGLQVRYSTYWSLFLSPLILAIRQLQALRLRLGAAPEEQSSDVYMPGKSVNNVLYRLVWLERKLLPRTPFGSSLFMVLSVTDKSYMFTGIVETTGLIEAIDAEGTNLTFSIASPITHELKVDQSVSHNGVCLTVIECVRRMLHRNCR